MAVFEITYSVSHPSGLPFPPAPSATLAYELDTASPTAHLESLEAALVRARSDLNERLTEWKDALKDVEKVVKKKKGNRAEDEDEEELDDEEEP